MPLLSGPSQVQAEVLWPVCPVEADLPSPEEVRVNCTCVGPRSSLSGFWEAVWASGMGPCGSNQMNAKVQACRNPDVPFHCTVSGPVIPPSGFRRLPLPAPQVCLLNNSIRAVFFPSCSLWCGASSFPWVPPAGSNLLFEPHEDAEGRGRVWVGRLWGFPGRQRGCSWSLLGCGYREHRFPK